MAERLIDPFKEERDRDRVNPSVGEYRMRQVEYERRSKDAQNIAAQIRFDRALANIRSESTESIPIAPIFSGQGSSAFYSAFDSLPYSSFGSVPPYSSFGSVPNIPVGVPYGVPVGVPYVPPGMSPAIPPIMTPQMNIKNMDKYLSLSKRDVNFDENYRRSKQTRRIQQDILSAQLKEGEKYEMYRLLNANREKTKRVLINRQLGQIPDRGSAMISPMNTFSFNMETGSS